MGSFYVTATIADVHHAQVVEEVRYVKSYVGPTQGRYTVVYPDLESMNPDTWENVSRTLKAPVFVAMVMDDDVLYYELWINGEAADQYVSDPGLWNDDPSQGNVPTGGQPKQLCEVFHCADRDEVSKILKSPGHAEPYIFESRRHEELAAAIGLPAASANIGYSYILHGELPEGTKRDELKHLEP